MIEWMVQSSMIDSLLNPVLVQRFAGSLLHFVWQGAIIAMVAAIVLRLSADRSAEIRYTVSAAALLLMLVAPVVTFIVYAQTGLATLKLLQFVSENVKGSAQSAAQAAVTADWTQWIVLAWFIGVVICSIRLMAGWRVSRSLSRAGTSVVPSEIQQMFNVIMDRLALTKSVRLLASFRIDTPVAVGWLRPVVLLPISAITGLNEDQLRAVFAHELAHIRRHDFLVNLLQRGVESILFYHPAVWWLSARIRSEREHCCDDLAVQICGDRSVYARALIELERVRTVDPDLAVAATGGKLTQRIHRVLGYRIVNDDWRSAVAALLFVVAWVMVGVWQSGSTLVASSPAPPPVPTQIMVISQTPLPTMAGAMNAVAAIVTAEPVRAVEPPESVQAAVGNGQRGMVGVIEGALRDDSGRPAVGVRVAARFHIANIDVVTGREMTFEAQTDKEGNFRFEGIAAGQYIISAGRVQLPTFYPGTLNASGSKVVTVIPGATVANINFAMEPMSMGLSPSSVVSRSPQVVAGGNLVASFGPGGTLRLYVSIQMEGGGKTPIFANGRFPKLRLTKLDTNTSYDMWFADIVIGVPRNYTTTPDEYKVAVEDLPEGYTVKSITYRADESGLRFEDVLHGTLKISARANFAVGAGNPDATGAPDLPIAITLTHTSAPAPSGIRVTGSSEGMIVDRKLPNVGGFISNNAIRVLDAGVYLAGKPGILYDDGTFEFAGVSPGLHSIVLNSTLGGPAGGLKFAASEIIVRDRDIEGVPLQPVPVLPNNVFSTQALPAGGAGIVLALSSLTGRILDEAAQQPVVSWYGMLSGIGGSTRIYLGTGRDVFRIPNLLPGQYSLTVGASGYPSKTQNVTVGFQDSPIDIKMTRDPK